MSEQLVSSQVLLACIDHRLDRISEELHRLARDRRVLQEQATRLRLGVSPTVVRALLESDGVALRTDGDHWKPTPVGWPSMNGESAGDAR